MSNDPRKNQTCLLEVIACTVEDAVEGMRGGANRLEIISRFDVGGLTPPLDICRAPARIPSTASSTVQAMTSSRQI